MTYSKEEVMVMRPDNGSGFDTSMILHIDSARVGTRIEDSEFLILSVGGKAISKSRPGNRSDQTLVRVGQLQHNLGSVQIGDLGNLRGVDREDSVRSQWMPVNQSHTLPGKIG